ncbi:MAG: sodium:proton antiporter [Intestinimonas sp.]|jgi:multicomponent Na+:H+ antiporter subunit D|nr:sodium:proton antiporter [Intestinimonas sp.]
MRPFVENFPFFCIFLAMAVGILLSVSKDGRKAYWISLAVTAVVAVLSAILLGYLMENDLSYTYAMGKFPAPFGNELKVGPLQALLSLTFSAVMGLSLLGGQTDLFADVLPAKQNLYFVMSNLILASLLALTYTNDLFTGYVFIEISTIAACALVMAKDTGANMMATIRYLFMSLLGSGLFLIGVALLYSITGHLLMPNLHDSVAKLVESGQYQLPLTVIIGLITVGLGIKSAMFPFHMWLPDAHGSATTASSAILSGLVLKGYIVLMMTLFVRVFTLNTLIESGIINVVLLFGLLGMVFGSLRAIQQTHIKRMLAYSSVAQVGYIFMGFGLGTEAGIAASCLHILVHACTKPMLFCCAGRLGAVSGHHKNLANMRGSAHKDVVAGIGFMVGALSMIGIPLFGGFVSKLYFANASLLNSQAMAITLLVIAVSTVLNALYYIPAVLAIWSRPEGSSEHSCQAHGKPERDVAFTVSAVCFILLVFALGVFYQPAIQAIEAGLRLM